MEKIIIDNAGTLLSTGIGLIGLHNDNSYFKDSKEQSIKSAELSTIGEIVMTLVQTDSDLVASRSESERDFYDQKNQQLQTLIISATVMMTALATVLFQGILPDNCPELWASLFGLTNGVSFALLFLSIIYCLEISRLASEFMIERSKIDQSNFDIKRTMTREFYAQHFEADINKENPLTESWDKKIQKKIFQLAKTILAVNLNIVERRQPNNINNVNGPSIITSFNHKKNKYTVQNQLLRCEVFWDKYVKHDFDVATIYFYLGSAFLLGASAIWVLTKFQIDYKTSAGAYYGIIPIIISLFYGVYIYLKYRNLSSTKNKKKIFFLWKRHDHDGNKIQIDSISSSFFNFFKRKSLKKSSVSSKNDSFSTSSFNSKFHDGLYSKPLLNSYSEQLDEYNSTEEDDYYDDDDDDDEDDDSIISYDIEQLPI